MNDLVRSVKEAVNKNQLTEYMLINLSQHILKKAVVPGEQVRIVFIFQSASFWPSWESVWHACKSDSRLNPIMLVCDDQLKEKTQFRTAQKFLSEKNIPFQHVSEVNLSDLNPHAVVLHTPYDGHRPRYLHAKRLSAQGFRVIYITYGIEISDITKAREDHFLGGVTSTAWRLYTFSNQMIPYYKMFSHTGGDMVRCFGHPKFDYLNKTHFPSLPSEIKNQAKGRKVILWKVHFPKKVNGKMITPSLEMYEKLLNCINEYKNLFWVFMPHPKFYEEADKFINAGAFKRKIDKIENAVEFTDDDYRPVLVNCDYYIVDRSALMIEAGVANKPVLYVSTKTPEKMTSPVQKIIDSYYQANSLAQIKDFLNDIIVVDVDPLKDERIGVFESIIPNMKGRSGFLIKEDIIDSLVNETKKSESNLACAESLTPEFRTLILELYESKEVQLAKLKVESEKIKNHLSYRLGNTIVKNCGTLSGLITMPLALFKSYRAFKLKK